MNAKDCGQEFHCSVLVSKGITTWIDHDCHAIQGAGTSTISIWARMTTNVAHMSQDDWTCTAAWQLQLGQLTRYQRLVQKQRRRELLSWRAWTRWTKLYFTMLQEDDFIGIYYTFVPRPRRQESRATTSVSAAAVVAVLAHLKCHTNVA